MNDALPTETRTAVRSSVEKQLAATTSSDNEPGPFGKLCIYAIGGTVSACIIALSLAFTAKVIFNIFW
jgi:hypothetical protein